LTCARIADSLGFGDEFQFSRRFKQFQGISPSKFRSRALGKGKP
jgi:AraC-like DNA-binding protein